MPSPAAPAPAAEPEQGASAPIKRAYPAPAEMPTQEGPHGMRFDFNDGCRVHLPEGEHPWRVRLTDLDTGNILFETELKAGRVNSQQALLHPLPARGLAEQDELLISHDYSAADREILIQFPVGTLGDPIGWFPYAVKFQEQHGCKLTCAMGEQDHLAVPRRLSTHHFVTHEEVKPENYYATYSIGLFFDDKDFVYQPCDFRFVGLHRTAGYILGVDPTELRPRIELDDDSRPIPEPYVCIAVQSTTQSKYWNNPSGWREIVAFLKEAGYRVICIDQKPTHGHDLIWNHIPNGAEDQTGEQAAAGARALAAARRVLRRPLERTVVARLGGRHAGGDDLGLHPSDQRVRDALPGDQLPRLQQLLERSGAPLRPQGLLWCPRHKDTPRQFECTRLITVDHVKATIQTHPGFREVPETAVLTTVTPTTKGSPIPHAPLTRAVPSPVGQLIDLDVVDGLVGFVDRDEVDLELEQPIPEPLQELAQPGLVRLDRIRRSGPDGLARARPAAPAGLDLHALDVDLDQIDAREIHRVDGEAAHRGGPGLGIVDRLPDELGRPRAGAAPGCRSSPGAQIVGAGNAHRARARPRRRRAPRAH